MDIERGPVVNDEVVLWRHSDDAHLRMFAEEVVANARPFPWLVERDDDEIWQSLLHTLDNFRIVRNLTDNFNVGLVCEGCKNTVPHETRTVRHEDPDGFLHCTLPAVQVSEFHSLGVRFKRKPLQVLLRNWVRYQPNLGGYQSRPKEIRSGSIVRTVGQRRHLGRSVSLLRLSKDNNEVSSLLWFLSLTTVKCGLFEIVLFVKY